jgi:hypothetical protein
LSDVKFVLSGSSHSEISTLYQFVNYHLLYTCRVIDSDGEFLLIEAADYLPAWANPETCEERVVYLLQITVR